MCRGNPDDYALVRAPQVWMAVRNCSPGPRVVARFGADMVRKEEVDTKRHVVGFIAIGGARGN